MPKSRLPTGQGVLVKNALLAKQLTLDDLVWLTGYKYGVVKNVCGGLHRGAPAYRKIECILGLEEGALQPKPTAIRRNAKPTRKEESSAK